VKFLLDVNALLAWRHPAAASHGVFHAWAARAGLGALATCAHSELGFLRVSMQAFGHSKAEAEKALAAIKRDAGGFVDVAPSPRLAPWATTAARTSDAYLEQVAASAGLKLATFDRGIPGAELIA
jgi:hypothetical protein